MEKIRERNFKILWLPAVFSLLSVVLCAGFAVLGLLVPPLLIVALIMLIAPAGFLIFSMIYHLYFYYQLSMDVNAVCEGDGVESKSFMFVIVLNVLTVGIYGLFWLYKIAQRLQANAPRYGFKMVIGGKEMIILAVVSLGWISNWEFVRNMNRFAAVYNQTGLAEVGGVQ